GEHRAPIPPIGARHPRCRREGLAMRITVGRAAMAAALMLVAGTTAQAGTLITGSVEVGGLGELGNFVFTQLNTAGPGVTLTKVTLDFTGHDVIVPADDTNFVPVEQDGVASFATFRDVGTAIFGFTATGFNAGDSLMYGLNLNKPSLLPPDGTGTPLGSDYLGGTATVDFS